MDDNIPAHQWYKWLEMGQRYERNQQTRQAIKAIKPKRKTRELPLLRMQQEDHTPSEPAQEKETDE